MRYAILIGVLLTGCAHNPTAISVAPAQDSITSIQNNLSRVDGKAVVIEAYLKGLK